MDRAEAKLVLQDELARYRAKSYVDLTLLVGKPETMEVASSSGARYQIEVEAFWDDSGKTNGVLRVTGAIDDGRIRAFFPIADSFLLTESGKIFGE